MAGIAPIPTTRVSNLLIQQRLLSQVQFDQLDLFKIQSQISSGRRITLPSEDSTASIRAIGLQRLIERKETIQHNLDSSQSFLQSTDIALVSVFDAVNQIQGSVGSHVTATSSDEQRGAFVLEIGRAIQQLVDIGNQEFRGRFLFGGSRTTEQPFTFENGLVRYDGNESELSSFSDLDQLFETSVNGNDVFGTISDPVIGAVDLNPILTENTKLKELNGGQGISSGSISISDQSSTSIIDLSNAETIGDVAALLEANPPTGRTITATVTATGLTVAINDTGSGTFSIREVGGGTTASELGLLNEFGTGAAPIVGTDLNPLISNGTQLDEVLGVRARAFFNSPGVNNDLIFEVANRGDAGNGITIQLVDDDLLRPGDGLPKGSETASLTTSDTAAQASVSINGLPNNDFLLTATSTGTGLNNTDISLTTRPADAGGVIINYTPGTNNYSISVEENVSTVADIVNAIQLDAGAAGPFTANLDTSVDGSNDGSYVILASDASPTAGSTGNSGAVANTLQIFVNDVTTTANDIVAAVNGTPAVAATITASLNPKDTSEDFLAGNGTLDLSETAVTSGGSGIEFDQDSGIQIVNNGQTHMISFATAETVEDMLNILNASDAGVLAEINQDGSGINVRSRISGSDFSIGENGGDTATQLGLRSITTDTQLSELNFGRGIGTVEGDDLIIRRNDGTELNLDLSNARTVGDYFDLINNHPDNQVPGNNLVVQLSAVGNSIEYIDDNPTDENTLTFVRTGNSSAAEDLGLVPIGQQESDPPQSAAIAASATLAFSGTDNDIQITATQLGTAFNDVDIIVNNSGAVTGDDAVVTYNPGANTLTIDIDPTATTANTLIQKINELPEFVAERSTTVETTNAGTGLIADLGTLGTTADGAAEVFTTVDINPLETKGIFNSLIRLSEAVDANDLREIERAAAMLDEDMSQLFLVQAEIGARGQTAELMKDRIDFEVIELQSILSTEIDVDLVEAISALTARQASFQASLQTAGQIFQLTLLDFI